MAQENVRRRRVNASASITSILALSENIVVEEKGEEGISKYSYRHRHSHGESLEGSY
jgi:hypothetical protein